MFFILGYYIYLYIGLLSYLLYLLQYANKIHLRYRIYLTGIYIIQKIRDKVDNKYFDIIKKVSNNLLVYTELIHGFVEGLSLSKPMVELKKYSCIDVQTDTIPEPEPIIKEVIKEVVIEKKVEVIKFMENPKKKKDTVIRNLDKNSEKENTESNNSKKSVFIKIKKNNYEDPEESLKNSLHGFTESEADFGESKKKKKKNSQNSSSNTNTKSNKVKVSIASRY